MTHAIETIVDDPRWERASPSIEALALACRDAVASRASLEGDIALLLTNDARLRALNAEFRQRDAATNVLSFPAGDQGAGLGDIALAFETCEKEARDADTPLADHAAHLMVHGMLHLVGYDHQTDDDAEEMETLEIEILAALGVDNPYVTEAI